MSKLHDQIEAMAGPTVSAADIVRALGCDRSVVHKVVAMRKLTMRMRARSAPRDNPMRDAVLLLSDGTRTSTQIATLLGCTAKYAQRVMLQHGAMRLPRGGRLGDLNHGYVGGRQVDLDGYVAVLAPVGHPHMRKDGSIAEHRLVLERHLGRYLLPTEIVDHIDGLQLHNAPENLRLFASNAEHLRATLAGRVPQWSPAGWANMKACRSGASLVPVDTYRQRKACGDVRLRQILLAALSLGIDSPFLSGTLHHLTQAGIDYSSSTTIERALADLYAKWPSAHAR